MLSLYTFYLLTLFTQVTSSTENNQLTFDTITLDNGMVLQGTPVSNDVINEEFTKELVQVLEDINHIETLIKDLGLEVISQGDDLQKIEESSKLVKENSITSREIISQTLLVADNNNFFKSLIKNGISFSAAAGVGSISFFSAKSLLVLAPTLPLTSTIMIPLGIASVTGLATYVGFNYKIGSFL